MTYIELIEVVRNLHPIFKNFHLSPCGGCNGPAYQQPCRICGFYPYGNDPQETKRASDYKEKAKEIFIRSVNEHNNIVAWYISEYFNTCLFKPIQYVTKLTTKDFILREEIQNLYSEQKAINNYPSPEQIWKWVVKE